MIKMANTTNVPVRSTMFPDEEGTETGRPRPGRPEGLSFDDVPR